MKNDITKTPLWHAYEPVLRNLYGQGGDSEVELLVDEMLDAIRQKLDLMSDAEVTEIGRTVEPFVARLGEAFVKDIQSIRDTGLAEVIDDAMA